MTRYGRYKKIVLANWPIKLTALVLAMVLWAVFAAEEATTEWVVVNLEVEPPEGRTVMGALPTVRAQYRGTLREVLDLFESPPTIHKTIPSTTGTSHELELSLEDLQTPDNADVVAMEISPDVITVVLDDMLQRTVAIMPRITLRPDSGHEIFGNIEIAPTSATLQGPEALVTAVQSVYTAVVERNDLTEPIDIMVPIDTSGMGFVSVQPSRVRVTADIGAVLDQVLMGVAVDIVSEEGQWVSQTSAVSVTVSGPAARVMRFTRDSVRVVARPTASDGEEVVALEVETPTGVQGVATPDSVLVRRSGGG